MTSAAGEVGPHVVVSVDAVALAAHLAHAQPVEPPARRALHDLGRSNSAKAPRSEAFTVPEVGAAPM